MEYQKIENYGIIGNMLTTALVGMDGSIDWMCYPHMDSPSIFGRILDKNTGGYFKIAPVNSDVTKKQFYWPDTNVLITRFLSKEGVFEVVDYMPVGETKIGEQHNRLVRWIKMIRGNMKIRVECFPAFNYARDSHNVIINNHGAGFYSDNMNLGLATSVPLQASETGVRADIEMKCEDTANFVVKELTNEEGCENCFSDTLAYEGLTDTIGYLRRIDGFSLSVQ